MERSVKWYQRIRVIVLLALLATAAGLCLYQKEAPAPEPAPTPAAVVSTVSRRDVREEGYQKDLEVLQTLAQKEDGELAREQLAKMIAAHQSELAIEEALLESGFEDAMVIVQGGSVTVMLSQEKMTQENSAGILALCMAHADVGAGNVRLMEWTE